MQLFSGTSISFRASDTFIVRPVENENTMEWRRSASIRCPIDTCRFCNFKRAKWRLSWPDDGHKCKPTNEPVNLSADAVQAHNKLSKLENRQWSKILIEMPEQSDAHNENKRDVFAANEHSHGMAGNDRRPSPECTLKMEYVRFFSLSVQSN